MKLLDLLDQFGVVERLKERAASSSAVKEPKRFIRGVEQTIEGVEKIGDSMLEEGSTADEILDTFFPDEKPELDG